MNFIRVKIYIGDEIRRFTVPRDVSLEKLIDIIAKCANVKIDPKENPIQYRDEEGDLISISTEFEWKDALAQHENQNILRLYVKGWKKQEENPFVNFLQNTDLASTMKEFLESLDRTECPMKHMRRRCHRKFKRHCPFSPKRRWEDMDVHFGVICDGCEQHNFKGKRFKCEVCPDFDFCESCYNLYKNVHFGGDHKFYEVEPRGFFSLFRRCPRPKEEKKEGVKEKTEEKEEDIKTEEKVEKKEKEQPIKPVLIEEKKQDECVKHPKIEKVKEPEKQEPMKKEPNKFYAIPERFKLHLQILESMGFDNTEYSVYLLSKYNGNLQKVVDEYLKQK